MKRKTKAPMFAKVPLIGVDLVELIMALGVKTRGAADIVINDLCDDYHPFMLLDDMLLELEDAYTYDGCSVHRSTVAMVKRNAGDRDLVAKNLKILKSDLHRVIVCNDFREIRNIMKEYDAL